MEEFPGNSSIPSVPIPSEAKKEVHRLVEGKAVRRKKPLGRKISDAIFGGDGPQEFGLNIVQNVFLPAAKDMIAEVGIGAIERSLFGDVRSTTRRGYAGYGPQNPLNYGAFSSLSSQQPVRPTMSRRGRSSHNFDEILLPTLAESRAVLDRMLFIVGKYGSATVSDLYELVDIPASPQDDNWGWAQLDPSEVSVHRTRSGFLLDLPHPYPLES